jgi:hypothetical protein
MSEAADNGCTKIVTVPKDNAKNFCKFRLSRYP